MLPGGSPAAVALHHARTVCRRAERAAVALAAEEPVNADAVRYLNRLSDLLRLQSNAARHANNKGADDVLWTPARRA